MSKKQLPALAWMLLAALCLGACVSPTSATPTGTSNAPIPDERHTQAAETVFLQLTLQAGETAVRRLTELAAVTPTGEAPPPLPEVTPTLATETIPAPQPTPTPPPPAPTAQADCERAEFVRDVNVPAGSTFAPGTEFVKTWRIENTGTCAWTREHGLVFVSGEAMSGPTVAWLEGRVEPGETVDVSVPLAAPLEERSYTGFWKLRGPSGVLFGVGPGGLDALEVNIRVLQASQVTFNLDESMCTAAWVSGAGSLQCPGSEADGERGFVSLLASPMLEDGQTVSRFALLTFPSAGPDGQIAGRYPIFSVRPGDRFRATLGCLDAQYACNVTFQLNYRTPGGRLITLGEWAEIYDGSLTRVNLDLSQLEGQRVELILTVLNNGDAVQDAAFWLNPRIVRSNAPADE